MISNDLVCSQGHLIRQQGEWAGETISIRCPICGSPLREMRDGDLAADSRLRVTIDSVGPSKPDSDRSTLHDPLTADRVLEGGMRIGEYTVEREIGRGGMGVVYKARHESLRRPAAIKMILAGAHAGEREIARFRIEAMAIARLTHPGIVQVYEVGQQDERAYLVLELVDGSSLEGVLSRGRLSPIESARMMARVSEAVHAAHERGIVHRDLKPGNILLTKQNDPKITDFGLAKMLDDDRSHGQTKTGAVLGTPTYMSPEQASGDGKTVGPHADIYALGAILYEMLTGQPPFQGSSIIETLEQVMLREPVPPRRINASIPRDLETICLKCLEKDPEKRIASAKELALELERFLRGEPIRSRPIGTLARSARWCRRHPWPTSLLALVAASLASIVALSVRFGLDERSAKATIADILEKTNEKQSLLLFERGHEICQLGDVGLGAQWLVHALGVAPAGAVDMDRVIRLDLGHWFSQLSPLEGIVHHNGRVTATAISPSSKVLATAGRSGQVRLWSLADRREVGAPIPQRGLIHTLAFPSESTLLVAGDEPTARLWNLETRALAGPPLAHEGAITRAVVYDQGRRVATASVDHTARLWRARDGQPIGAPLRHDGPVSVLLVSPDDNMLVTATGGKVITWDAQSGKMIREARSSGATVLVAAFRPDGGQFAISDSAGDVQRFSAVTSEPIGPALHLSGTGRSIAYGPSKLLVVGGDDALVTVWNSDTGTPWQAPIQHQGPVSMISFTPDGRLFQSSSWTSRIRDANKLELHGNALRHGGRVLSVTFSPDSKLLAGGAADGAARWWSVSQVGRLGAQPWFNEDRWKFAAFGPRGRRAILIDRDGKAMLWDLTTQRAIQRQLDLPIRADYAMFNPGGHSVLISGQEIDVHSKAVRRGRLFVVESGAPLGEMFNYEGQAGAIAIRPADDAIVWSERMEGPLREALRHYGSIRELMISPDGARLLVQDDDMAAWLLDARTGELVSPLRHQNRVYGWSFCLKGSCLATASADRTARVWDVKTGEPLTPPLQHSDAVVAVAVSMDGRYLATGTIHRQTQLWSINPPLRIGAATGHSSRPMALGFDHDDRSLFVVGTDGSSDRRPFPTPVEGTVEQLRRTLEFKTGERFNERESIVELLSPDQWNELGQVESAVSAP